ncbi:MAG TPA: hypothetical protein VGQ26_24460 [Streptosporangiaceae bacterium]|jgi:hypothetical protein|nr:hypothetical protein [Streptosporangiaceae bacterium]
MQTGSATAGLPAGAVQAAVLGLSGHPPAWAAYATTSQNPAAAASAALGSAEAGGAGPVAIMAG